MNKKKKILPLLVVVTLSFSGCSFNSQPDKLTKAEKITKHKQEEERENKEKSERLSKYTREKYGFDVEFLYSTCNGCISNSKDQVQRTDIPEIKFEIKGSGIPNYKYEDDYQEYYKIYQFNQEYLQSDAYQKLKEIGFEQSKFLGEYYYDYSKEDKNGKSINVYARDADFYLFRPGGITKESELQFIYDAFPILQELKQELKKTGYKIDELIIADTKYAEPILKNELQNYNDETEIRIADIHKINTLEELKMARVVKDF